MGEAEINGPMTVDMSLLESFASLEARFSGMSKAEQVDALEDLAAELQVRADDLRAEMAVAADAPAEGES